MEAILQARRSPLNLNADKALAVSVRFWFVTTLIGQWLFACYIAVFYGGTALDGHLEKWKKVLTVGWAQGDSLGNAAMIAHLIIAVIIMVGGPLQLMPQIRARAPRFHRILGRTYVLAAVLTSLAGIFMEVVRPTAGDLSQHIGTGVGGLLVVIFAVLAFSNALTRNFAAHQRWALRLFMVVSGVWFFRLGLMFWLLLNHGPVGFDPHTFRGPFLTFLAFAEYLIPLVVLELYLRARSAPAVSLKWALAGLLTALTLAMSVGIAGAFMGMWLPHL